MEWGTSLSDLTFVHQFNATGLFPELEEANYKHIDSLKIFNSLEGATTDSLWWGIGAGAPFVKIKSAFDIDTVFRYPIKTYNFKSKHRYSNFLGTDWVFEAFTKNNEFLSSSRAISGSDTTHSASDVQLLGPSEIAANFKDHMRTAGANMNYGSQRKQVFNYHSNKMYMTYESRGNIYLAVSTDGSAPHGCTWGTEMRINWNYGHSINPSIAWLRDSLPWDSSKVIVVWEDSVMQPDSTIQRVPRYSLFTNTGDSVSGSSNVALGDGPFYSAHPAAPMVCPVAPHLSGAETGFGNAVAVWSNAGTLSLELIERGCDPGPPISISEEVPNSSGGRFPAIEPGLGDTNGCTDCVDFNLVYLNAVSGGYDHQYLRLHCGLCSAPNVFCYTGPTQIFDTAWLGSQTYLDQSKIGAPTLAVQTNADPIVAFQFNGIRSLFITFTPLVVRAATRSRDTSASGCMAFVFAAR